MFIHPVCKDQESNLEGNMGKVYEQIDTALEEFISAQRMFFVATAPLEATDRIQSVGPRVSTVFACSVLARWPIWITSAAALRPSLT